MSEDPGTGTIVDRWMRHQAWRPTSIEQPPFATRLGSWFSLKKSFWQPYWWRLLFREDGSSRWEVMGPKPVHQVPNDALKNASLEAWGHALLEEAPDELDDLRGDLLLECYEEPAPAEGTPPVYSRQIRLPGYTLPSPRR